MTIGTDTPTVAEALDKIDARRRGTRSWIVMVGIVIVLTLLFKVSLPSIAGDYYDYLAQKNAADGNVQMAIYDHAVAFVERNPQLGKTELMDMIRMETVPLSGSDSGMFDWNSCARVVATATAALGIDAPRGMQQWLLDDRAQCEAHLGNADAAVRDFHLAFASRVNGMPDTTEPAAMMLDAVKALNAGSVPVARRLTVESYRENPRVARAIRAVAARSGYRWAGIGRLLPFLPATAGAANAGTH